MQHNKNNFLYETSILMYGISIYRYISCEIVLTTVNTFYKYRLESWRLDSAKQEKLSYPQSNINPYMFIATIN